jgi:tetratricopeptide (TPR) repeat protein
MKKILLVLFMTFFYLSVLSADEEGDLKAKYLKAVISLSDNNVYDAEKRFIEIINITNINKKYIEKYKARSYYFLGDVYFLKQDYEKSIKYYKTTAQKYYNEDIYSKSLYKLGRTLVINNNSDEGIDMLNDYIAKYDNSDQLADNAYYWMARGYIAQGDYLSAFNTYQLILKKYPSTPLTYDIRNSMDKLEHLIDEQNCAIAGTNSIQSIKQRNVRLAQEKTLLEKMAELLQIKQRLLEIKSEKVEIYNRLKEQSEG